MSYNEGAIGLSANHALLTPMIYDIAAVQQIYGKANINMSTKDDTTYNRTENAIPNSTLKTIVIDGVKHEMFTLWDAGGYHDLIDISAVGEAPMAKGYTNYCGD
jgi:hypothetical protein